MAKITISAHDHIGTYKTAPAYARVIYHQSFVNDDNDSVAAGDVNGAYFVQVAVTYSGGITAIPSFTGSTALDSTIVAADGRVLSLCSLTLHDANGQYIDTVFDNIRIPATPTTTGWSQLKTVSEMVRSAFRPGYPDQAQMQAYVEYAIAAFPRGFSQLSDVTFSSLANGDIPVYNSVTGDWENEPFQTKFDEADVGNWALRFDASKSHNACHGLVDLPGVNYTNILFQAFVQPEGGQYIYSSGYGGGHTLLIGFTGDTNGYTLTGNFYNMGGGTSISFATSEKVRHGEPVHVGVAYDGAKITLFINGVPSSITPYTGVRNVTAVTDAVAFIGGSDHQNYTGLIWGWQIFRTDLPAANFHNTTFRPDIDILKRPKLWDGSALRTALASVDYRFKQLLDNSGNAHHGVLTEATNQGNTLTAVSALLSLSAGVNRVPANAPTWERKAFAYTTTAATAETPPVGAVIFDSFGRADIHKGNYTTGNSTSYEFALGTTEVGSRVWGGNGDYGILNGNVYPTTTTPGVAPVTDTQVNREITIVKPTTEFVTNEGIGYRVVFQFTDQDNYNFVDVDEFGTSRVWQKVAGVLTQAGSNLAFGTGWTTLKVILTGGNTVAVYNNTSLIGTRTVVSNLAATGKGFELNHPVQRISSFLVA